MRLSPAALLVASLTWHSLPATLAAQAVTYQGGSVERFLGEGGHAVAFMYRRTEAAWHGLGIDLGVGVFPVALAVRTARLQVDAGLAMTQRLGPAALILKAGFGSRLDVGPSPEFIPGLQAGAAAVIPIERLCGFRVDLTRRVLFPDGGRVSRWSIGVGLTILPDRRGADAP
jgi:hypothetical protein